MCLEYMLGPSFEIIAELQQPVHFPGKPTTWMARAMWHMAFSCVVAVLNFQGWIGGGLGELLNQGSKLERPSQVAWSWLKIMW